jgi:hypothetical protein
MDLTSVQFLDITYRAIGKLEEADFYKKKITEVKTLRAQQLQ